MQAISRVIYRTATSTYYLLPGVQVVYDPEVYQELVDGGVDDLMAKHIAHLFIRTPAMAFQII